MAELDANTVYFLLGVCLALLVLAVLLVFRISARLRRLEELLTAAMRGDSGTEEPSVAETSPGGAFEAFLKEDPAHREGTKAEQFAAYRDWRRQKGMNWSQRGN
jgi:hypothetical protein